MVSDEVRTLEAFASRHGQELLTFAYLSCGDSERAQDAVQSVLVRLLPDRIDSIRDPVSYARRAIVNELASLGRRDARWRGLLPRLATRVIASDATQDLVERAPIVQALDGLSARQRAVVVLRYYEQLDDAEIARVLTCEVATVRSIARRALLRLRERLNEMQVSDSGYFRD